MALVTQKEYARRRKLSAPYISKLVRQGKIVLRNGLVDPEQADEARAPQRPSSIRPRHKGSNAHGGGRPARPNGAGRSAESDDFAPSRPSATGMLTNARAADAGYQAKLRKLEFEEKTKQLLPAAEVLEAMRRQNANIRLRLRGLARPLAPRVARETVIAVCERIMLDEFENLLREWENDPLGSVGPAAAPAPEPSVQTSAGGATA